MGDLELGFYLGIIATCLFWFLIDNLRDYMIKKDPKNPHWLHNQILSKEDVNDKNEGKGNV